MLTNVEINEVYQALKNREIHPHGTFDNGGRFYLSLGNLINVRRPSRAWPFSQMTAGRTLKFVKAVVAEFNPQTKAELMKRITHNYPTGPIGVSNEA